MAFEIRTASGNARALEFRGSGRRGRRIVFGIAGFGLALSACSIVNSKDGSGGSGGKSDANGGRSNGGSDESSETSGGSHQSGARNSTDGGAAGADAVGEGGTDAGAGGVGDAGEGGTDSGGAESGGAASGGAAGGPLASCPDSDLPTTPQEGSAPSSGPVSITAVYASRLGQNLHLEVQGTGFGAAPRTLPAVTQLSLFQIKNVTAGGWCAGYPGCAANLQYTSWTDTKIVIDGFGAEYGGVKTLSVGDQVQIYVKGSSGENVTWTGTFVPKAPPPLNHGGPTPQVCSVNFSQVGQNLRIVVEGAGFGTAPRTLPAVTQLSQFQIADVTAGNWCAGYPGCAANLQYSVWTDSEIVIDGFGAEYGGVRQVQENDSISIFVRNPSTEFTIWTGPLTSGPVEPPGTDFTPFITKVTFGQAGPNMHIQVDGSGFGDAPRTLHAVTQISRFQIKDITQGGWCAGYPGCPVNLQYTSWTKTRIVVDGFGAEYGTTYKVAPEDTVQIYVQNSPGVEFKIWEGLLPPSP